MPVVYFPIREFNSATYLGKGQVEKLAFMVQESESNLVVFNNGISPRIQRNLEQVLDLCVVDRQEIILQIFANRATTRDLLPGCPPCCKGLQARHGNAGPASWMRLGRL